MSSPVIPVTSVEPSAKVSQEKALYGQTSSVPAKPVVIKPPSDTLQLSTASRVASLSAIGRSVEQIAAILGISASEVDTDLGITTSTANSASTLTAAVAGKN